MSGTACKLPGSLIVCRSAANVFVLPLCGLNLPGSVASLEHGIALKVVAQSRRAARQRRSPQSGKRCGRPFSIVSFSSHSQYNLLQ